MQYQRVRLLTRTAQGGNDSYDNVCLNLHCWHALRLTLISSQVLEAQAMTK
jgi:hypothetical protein